MVRYDGMVGTGGQSSSSNDVPYTLNGGDWTKENEYLEDSMNISKGNNN